MSDAVVTYADRYHDFRRDEQATPKAKAEAREQRARRNDRLRNDEALCVLDFLTWADEQGAHVKRCVYTVKDNGHPDMPVCSREYDPGPPPEDEKLYEGTGIGTLFGLNGDGFDPHAWQLAGWNVTRREETT